MNRAELVKQAYAYGASVALQELGYAPTVAEGMAVKLAEDPGTANRILTALLGPLYAGATAPEGQGWKTYGATAGQGNIGALAGAGIGGAGGAGLGALAALLSRGKFKPGRGALSGGMGGAGLGTVLGQQIGLQKGLTTGYEE